MKAGSYLEAARYAEPLAAEGGSQAFWLTQQAKALVRAEDYRKALELGSRVLELEPHNLYAVAVTADALLGLKRYKEALPRFEELLASPRLAWSGRRGVLDCLAAVGQWELVLQRVSEWEMPEDQALSWKVKATKELGREEEALAICESWLRRKPHHPPALWERTELEIQRDGLEEVRKKFKNLAKMSSLPQIYREIYASLSRRAGEPGEAMKAYEQISATGAQTRIQKKQVFIMAKSGREREALPLFEDFLRDEPRDMYVHSAYAAACRRIGKAERAINFYHELLGLYPDEKSLYGRIRKMHRELEAQGKPGGSAGADALDAADHENQTDPEDEA